MKMNCDSLIRKWLLFSLLLLSPEIMAENLNFNFTRPDALTLEPRLSLQTRACHSLADPMNVTVRFVSLGDTKNLKVSLAVHGQSVNSSYAPLSSVQVKSRLSENNTEGVTTGFTVPWGVNVQGSVAGTGVASAMSTRVVYSGEYCFDSDSTVNFPLPTGNLAPIFDEGDSDNYVQLSDTRRVASLFRKYNSDGTFIDIGKMGGCEYNNRNIRRYTPDQSVDYYWPESSFVNNQVPSGIENKITAKNLYLYIFYRRKTEISESRDKQFNFKKNINEQSVVSDFLYNFPLSVVGDKGPAGAGYYTSSSLGSGGFDFTLSNRNILSMELTVTNPSGGSSVFKWTRNPNQNNYINNVLLFDNSLVDGNVLVPGDYSDDAYQKADFYGTDVNQDYFRGTLVRAGLLNNNYKEFNNNTPLSLPPDVRGSINVVNTDNLIITIGKGNDGKYTAMVYGQPLKFAPVYLANTGKVVSSAMLVRNACY